MIYDFHMEYQCPVCGKKIFYDETSRDYFCLNDEIVAERTYDCHGIPFRMVCTDCYEKIMDTKGFDGQYYTAADECIDWDY